MPVPEAVAKVDRTVADRWDEVGLPSSQRSRRMEKPETPPTGDRAPLVEDEDLTEEKPFLGVFNVSRQSSMGEFAEELSLPPPRVRPGSEVVVSGSMRPLGASSPRPSSALAGQRGVHQESHAIPSDQLDQLAWRLLKQSLGNANAAAISETPPPNNIKVRLAEALMLDNDILEAGQEGSCGFTVLVRRTALTGTLEEIGMCHHFTWDGQHCTTAGLGPEHANRCAGRLCVCGGVADLQLCKVVSAPQTCSSSSDNDLLEVVCGPPGGTCTVETCPFLAERTYCPYGTRFVTKRATRLKL